MVDAPVTRRRRAMPKVITGPLVDEPEPEGVTTEDIISEKEDTATEQVADTEVHPADGNSIHISPPIEPSQESATQPPDEPAPSSDPMEDTPPTVEDEPVIDATPVVETDPVPPVSSSTEGWDINVIRRILSVPKSKDSIPTLTCIDKGFYKRYFILDVDGDAYREAWGYYKAHKPNGTPEDFVALVTRILSIDMPRMHRAVSYVPLL